MMSHYSRKDALQKGFLSPNLNIMRMYNRYLEDEEPQVLEREKDIIRARQERRPVPEKLKLAGESTAFVRFLIQNQFKVQTSTLGHLYHL